MSLKCQVRDAVGFASDSDGSEGLRSGAVWSDLKKATLPFLRCAALFYHHLVKNETKYLLSDYQIAKMNNFIVQ